MIEVNKRPIRVPLYKELKKPFTETATTEPYEGEIVPTKWSFYIGMIISSTRLEFLWFDWIIIILLYYFFVYFNSYAFEKDVEPVTDDNIHKIVVNIEDQVEKEMSEKMSQSCERNDSFQEEEIPNIARESSIRRNHSSK